MKKQNSIFKQVNNFIESKFSDFTLSELKIMKYLSENRQDQIINIKLTDLAKLLNINSKHPYEKINYIVMSLFNKRAEFKFVNKQCKIVDLFSNFFSNIDYYDEVFAFEINYEVLDYFINFTEINKK